MTQAASRFRKLPPPRVEDRGRPLAQVQSSKAPDLFEHFGVEAEPGLGLPGPIVAAELCGGCGWLRRCDEPDRACPVCAAC